VIGRKNLVYYSLNTNFVCLLYHSSMTRFTKVHRFLADISSITLPEKFTFPFYYDPHPIAVLAAEQLQYYLEHQTDFVHNFGRAEGDVGLEVGKMFGVLVVRDKEGELGFVAAFSGKLADSNEHWYFVPPVFDLLQTDSFFMKEIMELNKINNEVERIEQDATTEAYRMDYETILAQNKKKLQGYRQYCAKQKEQRNAVRESFAAYKDTDEYRILMEYLSTEKR
jgi:tRNA pseudouridine32 synthase/23S rRNA pseudouridine746 synthase